MQVKNGEDLLEKYSLNANDAILAEAKHAPMSVLLRWFETSYIHIEPSYNELVKEHKVTYVAGGAAQNAARGAAVRSQVQLIQMGSR